MGSAVGVTKVAAARIGVSLAYYEAQVAAGQKWCTGCRQWHVITEFAIDRSRGDNHTKWCRDYANRRGRVSYAPRQRPSPGRRYIVARDGDRRQAQRRVNHLVAVGLLPPPNLLPCTDCDHIWRFGQLRHEYDHHLGYHSEHHESVEPVCVQCHHDRETTRRRSR